MLDKTLAKWCIHVREQSVMATSPMRKWPSLEDCCSPGRWRMCLSASRRRRCCWAKTYVPMMGSKVLGPTKCKNRLKGSGLSYQVYNRGRQLYINKKRRILIANTSLKFRVVCICCRNVYARVPVDAFLSVLQSPEAACNFFTHERKC